MTQRLSFILFICLAAWANSAFSGTAAVIIGNSNYGSGLPNVQYAERDADAIRVYLTDVLHVEPDNIIDLRNATKAQMETVLGTANNRKGKLWHYAGSGKDAEVFVYYSGHGVSGLSDHRQYLLPTDALPDFAELNGYPLSTLYNNLKSFKRATVVIDTCFSGSSAGGTLFPSSSGGVIVPIDETIDDSLTVLTASGANQLASWDHETRQGLFTEYFLRGVYGEADANKDGVVWADELKTFLDQNMTRAARRTYGREQHASLTGNFDRVFASYPSGQLPVRPQTNTAEEKQPEPQTIVASAPTPKQESKIETQAVEDSPVVIYTRRYGVSMRRADVFEKPDDTTEKLTLVRRDQSVLLTGRTEDGKWYETDTNGVIGFVKRANIALLQAGELPLWRTALSSGSVKDYRAYLQDFPDGYFAARAARYIENNTTAYEDNNVNIYRAPPRPPKRPPLPRRDRPFMPRW
ncbi:MAG: caspase family protein [Magnetovibrio sp.]|nr:caspase family protein [Magnetovibrio sp.]